MNDILMMILSALGAVAGAAAILASLGLAGVVVTAITSGAVSFAAQAAPVVICMGGVAYAASRTGYGLRG
jgi:hypothetical protein